MRQYRFAITNCLFECIDYTDLVYWECGEVMGARTIQFVDN